jgi:hypothetical protein
MSEAALSLTQLRKEAKLWWPVRNCTACEDPFDEMVRQAEDRYHKAASWEEFLEGSRDPRWDLSSGVKNLPHRA